MKRQQEEGSPPRQSEQKAFGAQLKQYRLNAGITQEALAERTGVAVKTVRNVENTGVGSAETRALLVVGLSQLRQRKGWPALELLKDQDTQQLIIQGASWLEFPDRQWLRHVHGPGALLAADNRVVPFHGEASLVERDALRDWCLGPSIQGIRIYRGAAGAGKTRLAVELCHQLTRELEPPWLTGFAKEQNFTKQWGSGPTGAWGGLPDVQRPILVVVDYAGDRAKGEMISELLEHLTACPAPKIRLLFLERDDLWLDRLHQKRAVREILLGPLLSHEGGRQTREIPVVARHVAERETSWHMAAKAFADILEVKSPRTLGVDLDTALYRNTLVIHSQALLTVIGTKAGTKDAILRHLLARERDYWARRLQANEIPLSFLLAVEQAVYQISLVNGVADRGGALRQLAKVPLLKHESAILLEQLVTMLKECYPEAGSGIGPLQPDSLKEFLVAQMLRRG